MVLWHRHRGGAAERKIIFREASFPCCPGHTLLGLHFWGITRYGSRPSPTSTSRLEENDSIRSMSHLENWNVHQHDVQSGAVKEPRTPQATRRDMGTASRALHPWHSPLCHVHGMASPSLHPQVRRTCLSFQRCTAMGLRRTCPSFDPADAMVRPTAAVPSRGLNPYSSDYGYEPG